jgi:exonuclease VII small subunit
MSQKSKTYEENFMILEAITESLNKDEIGIDDLVVKTREALNAARVCMEILRKQKGEFKKLENDFSTLMNEKIDDETAESFVSNKKEPDIGQDDPF